MGKCKAIVHVVLYPILLIITSRLETRTEEFSCPAYVADGLCIQNKRGGFPIGLMLFIGALQRIRA